MNLLKQRKTKSFFLVLSLAFFLMPVSGFSEDQSAGFYAGPLSKVAETVVSVKAGKKTADKIEQSAEEKKPDEEVKVAKEISHPPVKSLEEGQHG